MTVGITRLQDMATIPAGLAQAVVFQRANPVKKIQGQPTPQVNIVRQTAVQYPIQGLVQILSQFQPVDPDLGKPLYRQIQDVIRDAISSRALKPNDALPPERELAELFAVSRITGRNQAGDSHD